MCPILCTPWTVVRQAPLSMGFSRQEYWSGLPCPPPGDLPNPGIEPRSLALQTDSLPSELTRKPKNTGVGSLYLPQGIFLTQESNRGLPHCRQILYQLRYQGSPCIHYIYTYMCFCIQMKIKIQKIYTQIIFILFIYEKE